MSTNLLTILLCAGALTLHAAEPSPLATAKHRWGLVGGSGLKPSGAVRTGVALTGAERGASLARGGDGMVAEFAGGWLALADARLRLLKERPSFTLFLRAKADTLNGTLLIQQGPDKEDIGDLEFSAWPVPYVERQNLFSGLSKALSVRAGVKPRAPVTVARGAPVTLRFFAGRSVFELYANDEVVISNAGFFADPESLKAKLFQRGGAAVQVSVEAWEMEPLKWSAKIKP